MIRAASVTLVEFYTGRYVPLTGQSICDSRDKQYYIQFRHFARFLNREPTLADLNDDAVSAFLARRAVDSSPVTANKARNHILALWRFAARKGFVAEWPDVRPLREPRRIPRAWDVKQLSRLLAACKAMHGAIGGVPAGSWWYALHWFLWSTGERKTAACALEWSNVDLDGHSAFIPAEARKGKSKDMWYDLRPEAVKAMRAIREPRRKLVFPFPYSDSWFYWRYNQMLTKAGLPTDRKSKAHRMRVSFASHLEAGGGNATSALAHSARSVTERSYLDPKVVGNRQFADLLPDVPES